MEVIEDKVSPVELTVRGREGHGRVVVTGGREGGREGGVNAGKEGYYGDCKDSH